MNKKHEQLYKDFCKYAKLQDNSDAELPNITTSLALYLDGTDLDIKDLKWDPLDDPTFVSPEFLVYILLAAKEYFKD